MKNMMIFVYLLANLLSSDSFAAPSIRIGIDHPYSYTLNKSQNTQSVDCSSHANFYSGLCRSKANQSLVNYLSKAMQRPVEIINIEDRAILLNEFYKGNIDFVFFHLTDFAKAMRTHGKITKPLLTVLEKYDSNSQEKPYYFSDFFVKKNSGIKNIKELKNKRIGFRCYSASSSHIPYMVIKNNHLNPAKDLQIVYYPSSIDQAEAFLDGQVDAIAVWNYSFKHYLHKKGIKQESLRLINRYKMPDRVFAANSQKVSVKLQHDFVNAMLNMPKENYIGQAFSGVQPYQKNDYKDVLSLLNEYNELNINPKACRDMKIDKKNKIWNPSSH